MIAVAEKVKLGKLIFLTDIGVQLGKVIVIASSTGDVGETVKQIFKSGGNLFGGWFTAQGAKGLCAATIEFGPGGWAVCAGGVVGAVYYGSSSGDAAGEFIGGKIVSKAQSGYALVQRYLFSKLP